MFFSFTPQSSTHSIHVLIDGTIIFADRSIVLFIRYSISFLLKNQFSPSFGYSQDLLWKIWERVGILLSYGEYGEKFTHRKIWFPVCDLSHILLHHDEWIWGTFMYSLFFAIWDSNIKNEILSYGWFFFHISAHDSQYFSTREESGWASRISTIICIYIHSDKKA